MQKAENNVKGDKPMANNRSDYYVKYQRELKESAEKQKATFADWQNKMNELKRRRFS